MVIACTGASGACWEGAGSAAECCVSALAPPRWSASCREEDDWEGALGANLVSPPLLLAWVGAGGTGVDRGDAKEHGYRRGANQNSAATVELIWFDFSLPVFDEMPART
jgi:hypothetical protein